MRGQSIGLDLFRSKIALIHYNDVPPLHYEKSMEVMEA